VDDARKAGNATAKIKAASKQQLVDWIVTAVDKLREKPDLIKKSFVVTGIAPALNGAEDHLVRKDDEEAAGSDYDDDSENEFLGFTDDDINNEPSLMNDYLSPSRMSQYPSWMMTIMIRPDKLIIVDHFNFTSYSMGHDCLLTVTILPTYFMCGYEYRK